MPFKSLLNNYKEELLDLIFPRICLGCKKHIVSRINKYICQDCLRKITIPEPPFCSYCGVSICNDYSNVCAECRGPQKKFRRGFTASLYKNEMRDFIHAFKYNSHIHLKHDLGALMVGFAGRNIDVSKIDAIVPVPLDRKKLRDRGFNQSQELSNFLSKDFNVPLLSKVLYRKHKEATPQVNLSRRDRVNRFVMSFYLYTITCLITTFDFMLICLFNFSINSNFLRN